MEKSVTFLNENGLHARPAAVLVKHAGQFKADVEIQCGERSSNAKSLMGIMALGINKNDEIIIKAQGDDAEAAINNLVDLVANNFNLSE
ncbi:MAG: HPr family phosphocarrier protein [Bdellovibrionota bacterium]